ncbi:hypothetical protein Glove_49g26 [Diversispora epigaea]|uniref:Protein kinase domain-containing protein n=1 Tax=Diversispora epigaea TaxID=1348612 RepID=A0A397JKR3_9GLOM|nr:hypothetical protein Glove_49g26 [Diversispora epigaea]
MFTQRKKLAVCSAGHTYSRQIDYEDGPCEMCTKEHFIKEFGTWSSGNTSIDKIIQESQSTEHRLQWIPYDKIFDIRHISSKYCDISHLSNSGYYTAELRDCYKHYWNFIKQEWKYFDTCVVLKELKDYKYDILETIKEIKNLKNLNSSYASRFHGISKNPFTQNYIIIMESWDITFNLYGFLSGGVFLQVKWEEKIESLHQIIDGLSALHGNNLIHGNLNSTNIFVDHFEPHSIHLLIDPGLFKPTNDLILNSENNKTNNIYGSIPFIPPEVLRGENDFTKEGDIYSFGGILYELATGSRPFTDQAHDTYLMIDICNGVRPRVPDIMLNFTPKWFLNLMYQCWDDDPSKRPTTQELNDVLLDLCNRFAYNSNDIVREFFDAEDNLEELNESDRRKLLQSINNFHPQSCYISRHIFTLYELQDSLEDIKSGKCEDPNLLSQLKIKKNLKL